MTVDPRAGAELRERMARLIGGYQVSAAVGTVARLGVADALAAGSLELEDLAETVGADPRSLGRVLRALDDTGLFTRDGDRVGLAPLGELLRSDVPGSARRAAEVSTQEWRWRAYGHLTHSVVTGEPAFRLAHGVGLWEFLAREPDAAAVFNASMDRVAAANAAALVRDVDLSGIRRLIDVGGGHGVITRAVLEAVPAASAVIVDLPGVAEGARERMMEAGLADRCEVVEGDFFEAVPAGGDTHLLSWILHDWDDHAAARVLANCRSALAPGGRLLIVEMVVPGPGDPPDPVLDHLVKVADLEMLVTVGGRERTEAEYRDLLEDAGFALARIVPLGGLPWSVIEARPS